MADAADDQDDEDGTFLEIEAPGPDGRIVKVRGRLVSGPTRCPYCPMTFSVFETASGLGMLCHENPSCGRFHASEPTAYVAAAHAQRATEEAAAGVNVRGRGAA